MGVGREEQKEEEVCTKVNYPSSQVNACNVNFTSLMPGFPMCGPTPMPRVRSSQYPAAKELEPWPSLVRRAFCNWDPLGWSRGSGPQVLALPSAWPCSKRGPAGGNSGVKP